MVDLKPGDNIPEDGECHHVLSWPTTPFHAADGPIEQLSLNRFGHQGTIMQANLNDITSYLDDGEDYVLCTAADDGVPELGIKNYPIIAHVKRPEPVDPPNRANSGWQFYGRLVGQTTKQGPAPEESILWNGHQRNHFGATGHPPNIGGAPVNWSIPHPLSGLVDVGDTYERVTLRLTLRSSIRRTSPGGPYVIEDGMGYIDWTVEWLTEYSTPIFHFAAPDPSVSQDTGTFAWGSTRWVYWTFERNCVDIPGYGRFCQFTDTDIRISLSPETLQNVEISSFADIAVGSFEGSIEMVLSFQFNRDGTGVEFD